MPCLLKILNGNFFENAIYKYWSLGNNVIFLLYGVHLQLQLEYKPAHIYGVSPMRLEPSIRNVQTRNRPN